MRRLTLRRELRPSGPLLVWVMLNPSTADDVADDPTIRRCRGFAHRWGYATLEVVNLFSLRATNPRELTRAARAGVDVVGPENDDAIRDAVRRADRVCCAWGVHPLAPARAAQLRPVLAGAAELWCIGTTVDGSPRHPLLATYGEGHPFVLETR